LVGNSWRGHRQLGGRIICFALHEGKQQMRNEPNNLSDRAGAQERQFPIRQQSGV
jgi:hypothetical protein